MSDQINNSNNDVNNVNNNNIMRELSIIKASLAVGTSETANIKESIAEIKVDIKEIKTGYITYDQYRVLTACTDDHEKRLREFAVEIDLIKNNITKIMTWGTALVVLASIIEFIIQHYF